MLICVSRNVDVLQPLVLLFLMDHLVQGLGCTLMSYVTSVRHFLEYVAYCMLLIVDVGGNGKAPTVQGAVSVIWICLA